jgi:hypothetical protein
MKTQAERTFYSELNRLRSLYLVATYAFHSTSRNLRANIKTGTEDAKQPITARHSSLGEVEIAPNAYALWRRLDKQYPRYLREALFVRLISSFEVFLVQSIREVFLVRRDLFHSDKRLDISYQELLSAKDITTLWSRVIKRETRSLHNQGFPEIVKYYNRYLCIDFNDLSISTRSLNELHDRRHLIVHRLGKTDEYYRHAYNIKKKQILLDEDYFLLALQQIETAVTELVQWIIALLEGKPSPSHSLKNPFRLEIEMKSCDAEARCLLRDDFHFFAGEDLVSLQAIRTDFAGDDNQMRLILEGEKDHLSAYKKLLKQSAKKGHLSIVGIRRQKFKGYVSTGGQIGSSSLPSEGEFSEER